MSDYAPSRKSGTFSPSRSRTQAFFQSERWPSKRPWRFGADSDGNPRDIGRLDDIHLDGMELISEISLIYDNYGFETEILAASIRSANHVKQAALVGADIATCPPAVIKSLARHPLTDKGIEQFLADWKKTGQNI